MMKQEFIDKCNRLNGRIVNNYCEVPIDKVKTIVDEEGSHWFKPNTMRFFGTRLPRKAYIKNSSAYFISSEQFVGSAGAEPRRYSVREANLDSGDVHTVGEFNVMTKEQADIELKRILKK